MVTFTFGRRRFVPAGESWWANTNFAVEDLRQVQPTRLERVGAVPLDPVGIGVGDPGVDDELRLEVGQPLRPVDEHQLVASEHIGDRLGPRIDEHADDLLGQQTEREHAACLVHRRQALAEMQHALARPIRLAGRGRDPGRG